MSWQKESTIEGAVMSTYRMVYGDDQQVTRETFEGVELYREDGWTVLFRGTDAIVRVRDEHVQSLELLEASSAANARPSRATSLRVHDLMRPAVTSVERDAHLAAASYLMKKAGDNALVVIDDPAGRVPIAIITDTDVARTVADGQDPNVVRIRDVVSRDPITVAPETGVAEAAEVMLSAHIRHLPVVEDGRLVGMVDISDASRGLLAMRGASTAQPSGRTIVER
jgi:CBS domain-containing protein